MNAMVRAGKNTFVVTIDGPAGAGKSTVGRMLARRLSFLYLDTGSLYRAVAWKVSAENISPENEDAIRELCGRITLEFENRGNELRVFIDGKDVTEDVRGEHIGLLASRISAIPFVREFLLPLQRRVAEMGGVVAEGRDMGTVVFPKAEVKFFLDADLNERVKRRYIERVKAGKKEEYLEVKRDLIRRDAQDRNRTIAPLKVPPDAVVIDSTHISAPEVVEKMMEVITDRMKCRPSAEGV